MSHPVTVPLPHYILAGGQSRRFGSDKARHLIGGKPMISRVAEAFSGVASATFVVAQRAGQYDDLGLTTLADDVPGAGPLAGLRSALRHEAARQAANADPAPPPADSTWILLTSCDLVAPDAQLLEPLRAAVGPNHQAAVYRRASWYEPFPGLYRLGLANDLDEMGIFNRGSFQRLFLHLGTSLSTNSLPQGTPCLDMDTAPHCGKTCETLNK
ncbi:MAG: molybdenum cofactor guanylyltransferase [Planctomycetota bacterium]